MEIKVDCFDIRQIADSGQCFRMKEHPTKKDTFTVVVGVDYIEITQAAGSHSIELSCNKDTFANKWANYFDIPTGYKKIIDSIAVPIFESMFRKIILGETREAV